MRDEQQSQMMEWPWLNQPCVNPVNIKPLPGPYSYVSDRWGVDDCWAIQSGDDVIAYYLFWDDGDHKSARIEANFRLLAAAPEVVDAINGLLTAVTRLPISLMNGTLRKAIADARRIVAQAMGDA